MEPAPWGLRGKPGKKINLDLGYDYATDKNTC